MPNESKAIWLLLHKIYQVFANIYIFSIFQKKCHKAGFNGWHHVSIVSLSLSSFKKQKTKLYIETENPHHAKLIHHTVWIFTAVLANTKIIQHTVCTIYKEIKTHDFDPIKQRPSISMFFFLHMKISHNSIKCYQVSSNQN